VDCIKRLIAASRACRSCWPSNIDVMHGVPAGKLVRGSTRLDTQLLGTLGCVYICLMIRIASDLLSVLHWEGAISASA
jgi:hypothetical protein